MNPLLALVLPTALAAAGPTVAWKVPLGDWTGETPSLASEGAQLVVDDLGHESVLDGASGHRVQHLAHPDVIGRPALQLVLSKEAIVSVSEQPRGEGSRGPRVLTLARIDRRSGKLAWSRDGELATPIAIEGAHLFVREEGVVRSLDASTGHVVWSSADQHVGGPGLALGSETILITEDGHAVALSAASGQVAWQRGLAGAARVAPVACGKVFIAIFAQAGAGQDASSRVVALDPATGVTVWQKVLAHQEVYFPPDCGAGTVYLASAGAGSRLGQLTAWDDATGRERWSKAIETDVNHDFTPRLAGRDVLVWAGDPETFAKLAVSMFYRLLAFDSQTGEVRWMYRPEVPEKYGFSRPIVAGGRVVYSDGTSVVGIGPPTLR